MPSRAICLPVLWLLALCAALPAGARTVDLGVQTLSIPTSYYEDYRPGDTWTELISVNVTAITSLLDPYRTVRGDKSSWDTPLPKQFVEVVDVAISDKAQLRDGAEQDIGPDLARIDAVDYADRPLLTAASRTQTAGGWINLDVTFDPVALRCMSLPGQTTPCLSATVLRSFAFTGQSHSRTPDAVHSLGPTSFGGLDYYSSPDFTLAGAQTLALSFGIAVAPQIDSRVSLMQGTIAPVPLPGTAALGLAGLGALVLLRRQRRVQRACAAATGPPQ